MRSSPLPVRIQFDERESQAVERLFRTSMATGGNFDRYGPGAQADGTGLAGRADGTEVDAFEADLAAYYGATFVTAVSSGSGAVMAGLAALDLEPGSEVITSPLTDPGVVMGILLLGCVPVFVDHDYATAAMSSVSVAEAITPHTGAIVVTHLMGLVADMDAIGRAAASQEIPIIGDAAQAHGATYGGSRRRPLGDIGAVSLMSTKHMTSGGQGGFVATDDEAIHYAAKRFADRGKPFGLPRSAEEPHGGDRPRVGLNLRMHELEAVVGRVQLTKLSGIMQARQQVLDGLYGGLPEDSCVKPVERCAGTGPNPWGALFLIDRERTTRPAGEIAAAMSAEGIATHVLIPGAVPIVDQMSFVKEQRTLGTSSFPYGFELGGRRIEYADVVHPQIERLAQDLLVVWIHEGWGDTEVSDTLAAFDKVSAVFAS